MPVILRCVFFCLAAIAVRSAGYAQAADSADGPAFSFKETLHDFGTVTAADSVVHCRFVFINSGKSALSIYEINRSCPCFTVSWSRGPVTPGGQGWVSVDYPASDHPGPFYKLLWIVSNATNNDPALGSYELRIRGVIREHAAVRRSGSSKHTRHRRAR